MRREEPDTTEKESAGTDLVLLGHVDLTMVFSGGKVDPMLEGMAEKAKDFTPDTSTSKGRKEIASRSASVSSARASLDKLRKQSIADQMEIVAKVNASGKKIQDFTANLRDEVRKPLTDWEAEEARKAEELRLEEAAKLEKERMEKEESERIEKERVAAELEEKRLDLEKREAELEEKEAKRLREETAEREEKERLEREEKLKKDAVEAERVKGEKEKAKLVQKEIKAKLEKNQAEAREKQAVIDRKKDAEQAEIDRKAALKKTESDRIEAIRTAELEKQEAIAETQRKAIEEAEQKEAERLESERIEKERLEVLAADKEHRGQINREALEDLTKILVVKFSLTNPDKIAKEVITSIARKDIRNTSINY